VNAEPSPPAPASGQPSRSEHVTLADVAKRAGVSKTAASLILNNRQGSRLSEDAANRIRQAAKDLNYRPNPAARNLRLGTARTVGFISDDVIVTRYASAMVRGALDVAAQHDHTVLITETGQDARRIAEALEAMLDHRTDGVVFALMGAKQIELPPVPANVRTIVLNGASTAGHTAVLPDEYRAGFRIAELLIEAGHRDIAIIGYPPPELLEPVCSVTIGSRLRGVLDALGEAGVAPVARIEGAVWEPHLGYAFTTRVLDSGVHFTALLCLNDRLAFGSYQALRDRGLLIPDDISIASFDDDEIANYLRPGLTTARIPYEEMGRRAMEMLLDPATPPNSVLLEMPIQQRGSVRVRERCD
jgi:LacI family transcriptional regulator